MKLPRSRGSKIYLIHLLAVTIGLVLAAVDVWRPGLFVIGGSFCGAAMMRAVLPEAHKGMLGVRGRAFDVAWMGFLGVSLVILAFVVPSQPV